ncbi:MAG TPA: hypothetical protein VNF74_03320 [Terriglobales bacterium]|nr:hypothetical protein [Terriglobales bacterium]
MIQQIVREIAISKFKATCLAVVEEVRRTGEPIRLTRFGQPLADVVPSGRGASTGWVGSLAGTGAILGDIINPTTEPEDWDALR